MSKNSPKETASPPQRKILASSLFRLSCCPGGSGTHSSQACAKTAPQHQALWPSARAVLALAKNQPALQSYLGRWTALLDDWASFAPEPARRSGEVKRDSRGRIMQFDGSISLPDGDSLGFRAVVAWAAPAPATPLVLHFHGTQERALDYTEASEYHEQRARLRLSADAGHLPPGAREAHLAALRS